MEAIESFYNVIIDEGINPEVINHDYLYDVAIKTYILEKLTQKSINYPEFLNLNFATQADFNKFNRNLTGEIYRQFLNICRAVKSYNPAKKNKIEKKLERAITSFLDLKGAYTVSLNQSVSSDGKYTELGDIIPCKKWTVYEESNNSLFENNEEEEEEMNIKAKHERRQPEAQVKNLQLAFAF